MGQLLKKNSTRETNPRTQVCVCVCVICCSVIWCVMCQVTCFLGAYHCTVQSSTIPYETFYILSPDRFHYNINIIKLNFHGLPNSKINQV